MMKLSRVMTFSPGGELAVDSLAKKQLQIPFCRRQSFYKEFHDDMIIIIFVCVTPFVQELQLRNHFRMDIKTGIKKRD